MSSEQQVRQYLAYWFQLGKRVLIHNGREALYPKTVIAGDRYSDEFEDCWKTILSAESGECFLEGTSQTIDQLMSAAWEISACARCSMPVPMATVGMPPLDCPCSDLSNWPDNRTLHPRSPVSSQVTLSRICDRLRPTNS